MRIKAIGNRQKPRSKKSTILPFAFCLLSFIFCLLPFASQAQDSIKKHKIGLVLSGGGAKGFAHIGVLKVLEEAGVKIDFIGGTSMGAVIGGLYASGYNAAQIDSIVRVTNFDNLLIDFIPRTSKSFYEKRNDELYALILPFNKLKIGVPQSLSKGMFNYNLFNQLMLHVRHVRDFKQLPIPFLCLATDIERGEQVVMDKGVLAQALYASSALPSVFSPVILDGRFLIDGGITNNYPIEEVRKMGADIIIGVDVQNGLRDREDLKDASKILFQITNLEMIKKMQRDSKNTNIYIKPDIKDYGAVSFEKAAEIIQRGEEAAFSVYESIDKLADKSNPYKKPKLKIESDSLHIVSILCKNLNSYSQNYIEGKLKFKAGAKISYKDLETGINNIDATYNFGAVTYSLEPNGKGDNLTLNFIENPVRTFLKFGLHYDGLFKSAVLVNLTNKKTFFKNDVASFDFMVGDNLRYNLDYYIDNGYNLSIGLKSQLNQFNKNVTNQIGSISGIPLDNLNSINVDLIDVSSQFYIQSIFVQKFLIGGGLEYKYVNIESETLSAVDPVLDRSNYTSAFVYMKYDSFDNKYFPKQGWYFTSDLHNYLFSSNYTRKFNPFSIAKADFGIAFQPLKKTTLKIQAEGGFTIGDDSVPFFDFVLGGYGYIPLNNFKPFYGYDFLSLAGNSYLKTSATLDFEVFKKNHLNFSVNHANIGANIFESLDWISLPKYSGYAVGYGLETIIGPLEVKYSWSPETSQGFTWFSIGFWF
ncbi:patatin-like phospholipase family protein [Flavobacterium eburneipallidum]|uniref:patatin-like phospholipase family protein n=1 Tax=Flavobacterium eburneipallidum TaxID=3003263 RepID=UPI0024832338|nr:patatin-like phospholipase family protein [Flavobacterium eburneipallidum]